MTGKDLKIKLIRLGLTQDQLAIKLGVSHKTINTMCNRPSVPLLYQWALYGLELEINKNA